MTNQAATATDAQLTARAAGGDRIAFQLLYQRHWKAVYSYAWLLTRSIPDAEDVTQECFLALMRKPPSCDPARAQLRTWLIAVVRRQHLGRCRDSGRESGSAELDRIQIAAGLDEGLIRAERAAAVRHALAALPAAQQEALYLFEFEGLSLADVAGILEIETNAVKARLYRGREQLKQLLKPLQTREIL